MLYLAIICIACAVSAPCQGIAIIGRKSDEKPGLCRLDEGNRNETQSSTLRPYHGEYNGSSDCSHPEPVSNRTEFAFNDFIIRKQCNVTGVNDSCRSIDDFVKRENSRESAEIDVKFTRRRNLLWLMNDRKQNNGNQVKNVRSMTTCHRNKFKFGSKLSVKEKKKLIELMKVKNKKRKRQDFDLNAGVRERLTPMIPRRKYRFLISTGDLCQDRNLDETSNSKQRRRRLLLLRRRRRQVQGVFRVNQVSSRDFSSRRDRMSSSVTSDPVADMANLKNAQTANVKLEKVSNPSLGYVEKWLESDGSDVISATRSEPTRISEFSNLTRANGLRNFPPLNRKKRRDDASGYNYYDDYSSSGWEYYDWPYLNDFPEGRKPEGGDTAKANVNGRKEDAVKMPAASQGSGNAKVSGTAAGDSKLTKRKRGKNDAKTSDKHPNGDRFESTLEKPFLRSEDYEEDYELNVRPNPKLRQRHLIPDLFLHPYKYFKNRHGFRNYLIHKETWPHVLSTLMTDRRKRGGGGGDGGITSCSMPHKCWRSAPLLCIPYIRKGQDELLKYLIKNLQKMLGKPFPQKVDIFEKTKFKPDQKKTEEQDKTDDQESDDIIPEGASEESSSNEDTCQTQQTPQTPQPPPQQQSQAQSPSPPPSSSSSPTEPTGSASTQCTTSPSCPPCPPCPVSTSDSCMQVATTPTPALPCPITPRCPTACHRAQSLPLRPDGRSKGMVGHAMSATAAIHIPTARPMQPTQSVRGHHVHPLQGSSSCPCCSKKSPANAAEYYTVNPLPCDNDPDNQETATLAYVFSQTFPNDKPDVESNPGDASSQYDTNSDPNVMPCPKCGTDLDSRGSPQSQPEFNPPLSGLPDYQFNESPSTERNVVVNDKSKARNVAKEHFRKKSELNDRVNLLRHGLHQRRHKGKIKNHFPYSFNFFPIYDYEDLDNYSFGKKRIGNFYQKSWIFDKNHKKKLKKGMKEVASSLRKKRSYDYSWTPPSDNYDEYSDYPNYSDVYLESKPKRDWSLGDGQPRKFATTPNPPAFSVFADLAETMAEANATTTPMPISTAAMSSTSPIGETSSLGNYYTPRTKAEVDGKDSVPPPPSKSHVNFKQKSAQDTGVWNMRFVKNNLTTQKPFTENVAPVPTTSTGKSATTPNSPEKQDRESNSEKNSEEENETRLPTTLRAASIVKGPKKLLTKPAPKIYAKVYPDSLSSQIENSEAFREGLTTTTTTTTTTTMTTTVMAVPATTTTKPESATVQQTTATQDVRLQLLAICEGYLEALKLIRSQNPSLGEELDPGLSRYCENIISQSFSLSDQPKVKSLPFLAMTSQNPIGEKPQKITQNPSDAKVIFLDDQRSPEPTVNELNISTKPKEQESKDETIKTISESTERARPASASEEGKLSEKSSKAYDLSTKSTFPSEKDKKIRSKKGSKDKPVKKGITREQMELISLIQSRKPNLLSRLVNGKDDDMKLSGKRETISVNFDDEHNIPAKIPFLSGTIARKGDGKTLITSSGLYPNESVCSVYAQNYGYESGGQLKKVEVVWRKYNEKTHEKEILKNLSVLALLLTSTTVRYPNEDEDTRYFLRGDNIENSDLNLEALPDLKRVLQYSNREYGYPLTETPPPIQELPSQGDGNCKGTYILVNKPDPSSIVGILANTTTNVSQKFFKRWNKIKTAKEKLKEYGNEFLNYAIFILPVLFTVVFLLCCSCCFFALWRSKIRQRRRKRKKLEDDSSEYTSSDSSQQKRRHEVVRKLREERRSKKVCGQVVKVHSKQSSECEKKPSEKKRSFFRFLRRKNDDERPNASSVFYKAVAPGTHKECGDSDDQEGRSRRHRRDDHSEDTDRREIIALLDELKKIEIEHMEEKKDCKPVMVQYVTQEPERNLILRTADAQRPPKPTESSSRDYVVSPSKYYSICDKHFSLNDAEAVTAACTPAAYRKRDVTDDPEELENLLPCDCSRLCRKTKFMANPAGDLKTKKPSRCSRMLKVFRDSSQNTSYFEKEMDLFKSGNENYLFNKYRSVSTDTSDELLLGGGQRNPETEYDVEEKVFNNTYLPYSAPREKSTVFVKDGAITEYQPDGKQNIRLKDDGVLCRL